MQPSLRFTKNNSWMDHLIVTKLGIPILWTILHLPENFKSVPTYYDLWHAAWFPRSCQAKLKLFQCLKLANFGIFAGDMDMDRCCEVKFMAYTDIVTFPRSTEVIRGQWPLMTSYVIFRVFVPPEVIWYADFEFGIRLIRLSFKCVDIGSSGS